MTRAGSRLRTWHLPRRLLLEHLALALTSWLGYLVAVAVIALAFAHGGRVAGSAWALAAGPCFWYVAAIGGHLLYARLPLHVAHGRTRRDFAIEAVIFMVPFSAFGAALITVGYLLEARLYGLAGWPHTLPAGHLFSTNGDLVPIFVEYWLTFLVWTAAGALVGAAAYRFDALGWLALLPALALVALVDLFTEAPWGPLGRLVDRVIPTDATSLAAAIGAAIACYLIALALTWPIVRDLPLKNP